MSALRIKGVSVPANIVIVDLNNSTSYIYHSIEYLEQIEKVYSGAASKNNSGFIGNEPIEKLKFSEQVDAENLIKILKENNFTKIHLDENCIVGWATRFYKEKLNARKEDFLGDQKGKHKTLGEIRNPTIFKDYLIPYKTETNIKFNYLMDKLNDTLQKKNLGAFYTHPLYAKKSIELVRMAISRVPEGNDYIILDRCAGTGNLEKDLTDEELSHCILSTVEYYEYKVLQELLGSKVRHIIPPIEADDTFDAGLVKGADALSKEYVENPVIKQYLNNPKCTVILFENPPYAETNGTTQGEGKKATFKKNFIAEKMKLEQKSVVLNDLGNLFIWSAFKYYLRQPTDSYIVFSPVKYWKAQHLVNKKLIEGYAFNRRHFHTNIDACIMCAFWTNENSDINEFTLKGFDIDENNTLTDEVLLDVNRINNKFSDKYFDSLFPEEICDDAIACELNGKEYKKGKQRVKKVFSSSIIAYLVANGTGFDNPDLNSGITTAGRYDGNGFYLRKDNYLEKLPMFAASRYITYNRDWTERARIMKSADGYDKFFKDVKSGKLNQFLLKCLLFTCIEMQNHCRTFTGSDNRFYRNELCFDTTNGETLASVDIKKLRCNETETKIINLYKKLLDDVKKTDEYDEKSTYGIYQIFDEIDLSFKDDKDNTIYKNVEVHTDLQAMKTLCKEYYNNEIVPTLFEYEFLK